MPLPLLALLLAGGGAAGAGGAAAGAGAAGAGAAGTAAGLGAAGTAAAVPTLGGISAGAGAALGAGGMASATPAIGAGMGAAGAGTAGSMASMVPSLAGMFSTGAKGAANNPKAGGMLEALSGKINQGVAPPPQVNGVESGQLQLTSNEKMGMLFNELGGVKGLMGMARNTRSTHKPAPPLPMPMPQQAGLNPFSAPQQAPMANLGMRVGQRRGRF